MKPDIRDRSLRRCVAVLFFLSGFCGLVYQIIWTRLAFSSFGIITPVLSVILSTFMLGLASGSWLAGLYVTLWCRRTRTSAITIYGLAELLIGAGGLIVPQLFMWGRNSLLHAGEMNSGHFLAMSAGILSLSILPWCVLMGSTFPLMMAFVNEKDDTGARSFSFLYTANVLGALVGTVLTAVVLIELLGFHGTLWIAGSLNGLIALISLGLGLCAETTMDNPSTEESKVEGPNAQIPELPRQNMGRYLILFTTGFTGMALEVVWTRAFTMVLKTTIYSFALILAVYLLATWVGSYCNRKFNISIRVLLTSLSVSSFFPILFNDPRMAANPFRVAASLFPLCAVLGYLTPCLIDDISQGLPKEAGRAYAFNTLGCIAGPLVASYLLLPFLGVRHAMILLSIPLLLLTLKYSRPWTIKSALFMGTLPFLFLYSLFFSLSYEEGFLLFYRAPVYRRDHTATVVSCGQGLRKQLFVNGIPMTSQSVITKTMAHLPLGFLPYKPTSALTICFGMGTTYRSLLTWEIRTTGVELIPSVKEAFPYYFDDAAAVLQNPRGRIIIDDGRRYLNRTAETFDVIIIDPPPPIMAAGSSLLYSTEFYALAQQRLAPEGILQQWIPEADAQTFQAVVRSLTQAFPYVKIFKSIGGYGHHVLASRYPLVTPSADIFIERLPPGARKDFLEWNGTTSLRTIVQRMLEGEMETKKVLLEVSDLTIRDDHPYNEYYLLRHMLKFFTWKFSSPA